MMPMPWVNSSTASVSFCEARCRSSECMSVFFFIISPMAKTMAVTRRQAAPRRTSKKNMQTASTNPAKR